MIQVWLYTLTSVALVSLISLVGLFIFATEGRVKSILSYLVSFSAGALLGDVFIHILPDIMQGERALSTSIYVLLGIIVFFIFERFLSWHHSHTSHDESVHSVVYLTTFGDALHNLLDGIVIAASFLISIPLGIATTLAVIFHEIPQEIGQFAILVHGGLSRKKALLYNFASAVAAIVGAVLTLIFAQSFQNISSVLVAFGAASFIYVAMSDLLPELQKERSAKKSVIQFAWLLGGVAIMALLLLVE